MKYERPLLILINDLAKAEGSCSDGSGNIEICKSGGGVIPGCRTGGQASIECGGGGKV
jgi:hypothetical protein